VTVDVLFDQPGEAILENRTPDHTYELGHVTVSGEGGGEAAVAFEELRVDPELSAERERFQAQLEREPDKTLAFVSEMPILYGSSSESASSYVCPMHPEVTDTEQSSCPQCGMKLVAATAVSGAEGHEHGHGHDHGDMADGLEWEDLMPEINRQTNTENMIWQLVDRETGAENGDITWSFRVGDRIKIRQANENDQEHTMHHPLHIHGAGRFLVLSRDGEPEGNLAWKDTVLLRAGQTIDILLDVTNPGLWMAHCHIAEHTESGMMFSFDVAPAETGANA
jgi:FtsP/CotA-like multicopper oxidase with cupredoxin domain